MVLLKCTPVISLPHPPMASLPENYIQVPWSTESSSLASCRSSPPSSHAPLLLVGQAQCTVCNALLIRSCATAASLLDALLQTPAWILPFPASGLSFTFILFKRERPSLPYTPRKITSCLFSASPPSQSLSSSCAALYLSLHSTGHKLTLCMQCLLSPNLH